MKLIDKNLTLGDFQKVIETIYSLPDDRLYSIEDLLTHQQRFAMRALKGIRKDDFKKMTLNLLIALSWLMAISNRFHISVEQSVWKRFPNQCSYCGEKPCQCKKNKSNGKKKKQTRLDVQIKSIAELQQMFENIYPSSQRSLADAGVHFAEEVGEVNEAVHNYLGQHLSKQFDEIQSEIADEVSCIFGVANSAGINVAKELVKLYKNGCHVCHGAPCTCSFVVVSQLKT